MSKVWTTPATMTDAEVDEISAELLSIGFASPEFGRGGFLPILGEEDDADMILGRSGDNGRQ